MIAMTTNNSIRVKASLRIPAGSIFFCRLISKFCMEYFHATHSLSLAQALPTSIIDDALRIPKSGNHHSLANEKTLSSFVLSGLRLEHGGGGSRSVRPQ